jgi:hypothetical protein
MLVEDRNGTKPLFRSRSWNKEEREKRKKDRKVNWYKDAKNKEIDYKSVLFVPPTPGGQLAKEMRKREEELNKSNKERIKIVEMSGVNIENLLTI